MRGRQIMPLSRSHQLGEFPPFPLPRTHARARNISCVTKRLFLFFNAGDPQVKTCIVAHSEVSTYARINCHGINKVEEDERLGTQDLFKHGMTKQSASYVAFTTRREG